MKASIALSLLLLFCTGSVCAQDEGPDTTNLVYAQGNIISAETKQPVQAKIIYQSLPYGNKVGFLNNSSFSFPMFDGDRYSIVVEAQGYEPAKYMLDPSAANGERKVIQDIELKTGTPHHAPEVGQVMLLNNLIFDVSKARISPESYSELDLVVNMMKENSKMVVQLEGHTDYTGDPGQNMRLSQQRVDAVKSYLVSKGVDKKRILTKAFGGTQPLSKDDTPEAHRMNRRVELRIVKN
jgi:outer membrane protein OmpA-like peptidoglycan-associated protein